MSAYQVLCACLESGLFRPPVERYLMALLLAVIVDDDDYAKWEAKAQRREANLQPAEVEAARRLADLMLAEVRDAR